MIKTDFYARTLKTYIGYKLRNYRPFAIFFRITYRCNLECKKCFIVKKFRNQEKQELSTGEIFSLIEDASRLGVSYFSITGGEPLLRKDMEKIGKKIRKENMISAVSTNGTLITKSRAEKLVNSFDYIRISLDGLKNVDDKLRGKGSFERTCNGIKHLQSSKNSNTKIAIASVVSEENYTELEQFLNAFRDKVDFIYFIPFRSSDQEFFNNNKFIKFWKELKAKNKYKVGDMADFIGPRPPSSLKEGKKICDAGRLFVAINPSGDVFPCLSPAYKASPIGNLGDKSLTDMWNSSEILSARESARNCIGCYSRCHTQISKIFRMNPLEIMIKSPELIRTRNL